MKYTLFIVLASPAKAENDFLVETENYSNQPIHVLKDSQWHNPHFLKGT